MESPPRNARGAEFGVRAERKTCRRSTLPPLVNLSRTAVEFFVRYGGSWHGGGRDAATEAEGFPGVPVGTLLPGRRDLRDFYRSGGSDGDIVERKASRRRFISSRSAFSLAAASWAAPPLSTETRTTLARRV